MKESEIPLSYFINYWDEKHNNFDYDESTISHKVLSILLNFSVLKKNFCMDHGCGTGRIAIELAKKNIKLGLNDLSENAVRKTLGLLEKHCHINSVVHSFVGQIFDWNGPLNWGAFYSHRVIHNIPRYQRIRSLKFLADNLIKGGVAVITAKSINCDSYLKIRSNKSDFQIIEDDRTFLRINPFHYLHYFSECELMDILKIAGLKIIDYSEFTEHTASKKKEKENLYNTYWIFHCEK